MSPLSGSTALFFDLHGTEIGLLDGGTGVSIHHLAASPDGALAAAAFSDDVVRIWGLEERRQVQSLPIVTGATCLAFDHDSRRLLVGMPEGPVCQYAMDVTDLLPAAAERVARSSLTAADARRFALDEVRFNLEAHRADLPLE